MRRVSPDVSITERTMCDLTYYLSFLHQNLSPSIREALRQNGITLSRNVSCGYDSEYKRKDRKNNTLLSCQWAVSGQIKLTLPYIKDYELGMMNISSGVEYPINEM